MGCRSGGDQGLSRRPTRRAGPTLSWLFVAAESPGDRIAGALPPGCSARDPSVEVKPRRITVKVKRLVYGSGPTSATLDVDVDVGPQLPGVVSEAPSFDEHADDV